MYCEAVSFFIFESYSLFHFLPKEKYADISVFLFRIIGKTKCERHKKRNAIIRV